MLDPGEYTEVCTIERQTVGAADDYGQVVKTWFEPLTPPTRMCRFRGLTGREAIEAGRLTGQAMGKLRLDYSAETAAITTADRVRFRGAVWNIRLAGEVANFKDEIELLIERGVAAGDGAVAEQVVDETGQPILGVG